MIFIHKMASFHIFTMISF